MNKLLTLLIFLAPFSLLAQDCNCSSDFKWVKETFEQNDAGFGYILEKKGQAAYEKHNEAYALKLKYTSNAGECYELMRSWIKYFRKGHFGIRPLGDKAEGDGKKGSWETLQIDEQKFKEYLVGKKVIDYEGVWKSGPYKIAIKKYGGIYKGGVLEAKGSNWKAGQLKLVINTDQSCTYYMGDYSPKELGKAELLGDKYLQVGFITLERIVPEAVSSPIVERYYKAISSEGPYLDEVDEKTLLLRIPSFESRWKYDIDSVILANREMIGQTENMVIDLRGNGGGSDRSFEQLLPIIYTNPIKVVGVELLSTPRNNQRVKNFISNPNWSESGKDWARKAYAKLSASEGVFVNLEATEMTIIEFDTICKYPKQVGIIIDGQNASTTEQFLLAARQSKKVKLFGQTSFGALDISYVYPARSPCGDFELLYCLSRSLRIPEMTIDDRGIQPDYFIYNKTPRYKWIEYVTDHLTGY